MNSLLMQLQTCIVHLSQSGIECSFQLEYTNHFVFSATKMFRFNEGDIADDAAAYLLAIKESVCGNKRILYFCCSRIFCFGYFIIFSKCYFVCSRVLMRAVEEKANLAFVLLTRLLENFM